MAGATALSMEIGKHVTSSSTTGSSFEQELHQLLLQRARQICLIALVLGGLAIGVRVVIVGETPGLDAGLASWLHRKRAILFLSFALALAATYFFNKSARQIRYLAFTVVAFNLVLGMFVSSSAFPDEAPYLLVAFSLFIYAAFIPSPLRYTVGLGLLAFASFLLASVVTYVYVPGALELWARNAAPDRTGIEEFRDYVILSATGIGLLAILAVLTSHTLYSLRRTAHRAKRLGNYYLEDLLGAGGMGQVYRARHAMIRRPTAVKVMQASSESQQAALARFEREVQLTATLTHPNSITVYDFGRTPDQQFYYVMEYLDGLDIQTLVERFGPVEPSRTAFILVQACGALGEAHSRGIVHRDIKPSNVFLTQRGGLYDFVKVLDFGLAKQVTADEATGLTKTGVAVGTPRYISPEAVKGEQLDGRSDLYCLGAVAYWMLTGRPPFESSSSVELLIDHVKATPPKISEISEVSIPPQLEAVVMRCLEKDRSDRFVTAEALEAALREIAFEEPWTQAKALAWWELHGLKIEQQAVPSEDATDESESHGRGISRFFIEP